MATHISQTTKAPAINEATPAREVISYDPATGAEVGRAPLGSREDVNGAVARSRAAQKSWAALSFRERAAHIMRARAIVLAEIDDIAALIARESGKPAAEALSMEVVPTLDLMQHFARRAASLLKPERIGIGL
jgi:acyl-CoA reductase-like NAD-dependent aldehyde dehydrogenase